MSDPLPLLQLLSTYRFEPLAIHRVVDSKKRLAQAFEPAFPLILRFYSFPAYREMLGANWLNWHEHLEMIIPVTGAGRFRSGEQVIEFAPGDVLLVDNLKLHGMLDLDGNHQSLVIYFMPELVYSIGSCQCDAAFLAPFLERPDDASPLLRAAAPQAPAVHQALMRLVTAFFSTDPLEDRQALCKLQLLEMLYGLRRHFKLHDAAASPRYNHQRERVQRLKRLFDFLNAHYAEKLRLSEAAAMVGMSETRFKDFFKKTTGTTFAQYVIHLRLAKASQLLRDTNLSMSEIAHETGFCDQSHFDNRFKDSFQFSPKDYRVKHQRELAPG